jgi:molybdopterin synthase catalytic subunit
MSEIRIQTEDFDPGAEIAALTTKAGDVGAIASFIGLVRADDRMAAMTLDHYPGFAEREIATHVAEARTRWPLLGVRVVHRVGRLTPGERIVFVGVASSHRGAAFAAAEFLMDYLKTRAPFWKLEERENGATWVEARESDDHSANRWQR